MAQIILKLAMFLEPGDVCVGPSVDFTDRGTVECATMIDNPRKPWSGTQDEAIQVNWVGGMHTVRAPDYEFHVQVGGPENAPPDPAKSESGYPKYREEI